MALHTVRATTCMNLHTCLETSAAFVYLPKAMTPARAATTNNCSPLAHAIPFHTSALTYDARRKRNRQPKST
jgi:hypothetical protein